MLMKAFFAFLFVGLGVYIVVIFNGLIALKNDIEKAWANIDIMLKQRHDELTKLLEVCKGYMAYEQDTLLKITQARSLYQQASTIDEKLAAAKSTTSALRGLFAVAENYPALKANESFLQLQGRITDLENQISDRREYYNDCVNTFNTRTGQIPDTFVASLMQLTPRPMFKVEDSDKVDVQMSFSAKQT